MSLRDQSCYTLTLQPSATDQAVVELVEVEGVKRETRYARVKEKGLDDAEIYTAGIYGAKLASTGYRAEKGAKQRRLQLHGPDEEVSFEHTGKLSFEWTFTFGGNKFRWNKEIYGKDYICSLDRKPDPKVEICLARKPDKNEPGRVQILHYNIERFPNEITDLRGLETLLVTTFMSFVDALDERTPRPPPSALNKTVSPSASASSVPLSALGQGKAVASTTVVTEDDFEVEDSNEIRVGRSSDVDDRIARAVGLLLDPAILFVIIRTKEPSAAQRALEVALGVTRFRHREGLSDLHQYVVEQAEPEPTAGPSSVAPLVKGPKVIKLDDPQPQAPQPKPLQPATALNIAIYLSTIQLPDLVPKSKPSATGSAPRPAKDTTKPTAGPSGSAAKPAASLSKPAKQSMPSSTSAAPLPARIPSNPVRPSAPPAQPAKPIVARPAAASIRPPPPPANRPISPQPPPRPAPPAPAVTGDGKGKDESVMKKLIAMSRR